MKKLISLIVVGAMLSLSSVTVFADEVTRSQLQEIEDRLLEALGEDQTIVDCRVKLVPLYDVETLEFMDFLEEHFQNKSSTSSLANTAVARFRIYKRTLEDYFISLVPEAASATSAVTYTDEITQFQRCDDLTELYINLAKQRMMQHIKSTNYQKKTTAFAEKYKSINDNLRDLNLDIAEMYGFFLTFKNKLPGFLSQCVRN